MSRKIWLYLVGGGVVIAAVVLALVFGAFRNGSVEPKGADLLASSTGTGQTGGTPNEGIKIHGRWTIEVRNPNGTLAERREFDNALTSQGATELAHILLGDRTPGNLAIRLDVDVAGSYLYYYIAENTTPGDMVNYSKNLALSIPTTGPDANRLVMSGSITVPATGNITGVSTDLYTGDPTVAPASTTMGNSALSFTNTNLSPTLPVVAGQQVAAKVVIRFQ